MVATKYKLKNKYGVNSLNWSGKMVLLKMFHIFIKEVYFLKQMM